MVQYIIKNKIVIIVSLVIFIIGGTGGYFIGHAQGMTSDELKMNQQMPSFGNQGGNNPNLPSRPNGGTDANSGASTNSDTNSNDSNSIPNSDGSASGSL